MVVAIEIFGGAIGYLGGVFLLNPRRLRQVVTLSIQAAGRSGSVNEAGLNPA
jgi:hypothetical protein